MVGLSHLRAGVGDDRGSPQPGEQLPVRQPRRPQPQEVGLAGRSVDGQVGQRVEQAGALGQHRLAPRRHLRPALAQRLQGAGLGQLRDPQRRHQGLDQRFRARPAEGVAAAQPRQTVGLRERPQHDQPGEVVEQGQRRARALDVDEVHQRLVQQDRHVVGQALQQRAQRAGVHIGAVGVVGVAQRQHPRALAHRGEDGVGVVAGHGDRPAARGPGHQRVERIGGPGGDQLITRVHELARGGLQQPAGAVPHRDAFGLDAVPARQLAPELHRVRVRQPVEPAPGHVGDRGHHVRMRELVPGGGREVQRVDPGQCAPPALLGPRPQLLRDLLVAQALELPVVVEQAHGGLRARRELGREAADEEQPAEEEGGPDDRGDGEHPADHPAALVVARRAAHQDPHEVQPPEDHQPGDQREQEAEEGHDDARERAVGDTLDLGADPHPGHRERAPVEEVHDDHQPQDPQGHAPVHPLAQRAAKPRQRAVADGTGARAPADEQPARVCGVGLHGASCPKLAS